MSIVYIFRCIQGCSLQLFSQIFPNISKFPSHLQAKIWHISWIFCPTPRGYGFFGVKCFLHFAAERKCFFRDIIFFQTIFSAHVTKNNFSIFADRNLFPKKHNSFNVTVDSYLFFLYVKLWILNTFMNTNRICYNIYMYLIYSLNKYVLFWTHIATFGMPRTKFSLIFRNIMNQSMYFTVKYRRCIEKLVSKYNSILNYCQ